MTSSNSFSYLFLRNKILNLLYGSLRETQNIAVSVSYHFLSAFKCYMYYNPVADCWPNCNFMQQQ